MGTQERREREASQRREVILASAKRVFWQKGYQGATMPEIAAEAELAPGTLYLYFASKGALYAEILAGGYELLRQRLAGALAEAPVGREAAEGMIDAFFGFARECPEYFDIIFFVLQREGTTWNSRLDAEQVGRLAASEDACQALVAEALQEKGSRRGSETAVDAIWSMLAGVVFFFKRDGAFEKVSAEAKRILLAAVFG